VGGGRCRELHCGGIGREKKGADEWGPFVSERERDEWGGLRMTCGVYLTVLLKTTAAQPNGF